MEALKSVLMEMKASSLKGKAKEEHFVQKFSDISNTYPMLIKKACETDFDFDKMFWMIDQKEKVDTKLTSQHDASVEVGERLVGEYIKPIVD